MTMIIVEGCDSAGKTTLLMDLASTFKLAIARSYGRPSSLEDIRSYHAWARSCPQPLILDRHPAISDLVYGPIIRGGTPAELPYAQYVASRTLVIHCSPPFETVQRNIHNEPQMDGVESQLKRLYYAYENIMEQLQPDIVYDYTNTHSLTTLKEQVNDYLIATR